jgi:hypothetical protein
MKLTTRVIVILALAFSTSGAWADRSYVLEPDGNVYHVEGGTRTWFDGNAKKIEYVDGKVYIEGKDGKLWRRSEGSSLGEREFVDTNILQWQAIDSSVVLILGMDHRLWREHSNYQNRDEVDANTVEFAGVSGRDVVVKGEDGRYMMDHGNYHDRQPVTAETMYNAAHVKVESIDVLGVLVGVKVDLDETAVTTLKTAADISAVLANMFPGVGHGIASAIELFKTEVWAIDYLGGNNGVVIRVYLAVSTPVIVPR